MFTPVLIIKKTTGNILKFKATHTSDDSYYFIDSNGIHHYEQGNMDLKHKFEGDENITSEEQLEMISIGIFKNYTDIANLIVVKNYFYKVLKENYYCNSKLDQATRYPEIYPYECTDSHCYFVFGYINSNKELYLQLIENPKKTCNITILFGLYFNYVVSENLSCQYMKSSSNEKVLTCFYQYNNSELIANNFKIDINNDNYGKIQANALFEQSIKNNGAKYIKSILSTDESKCLVCYINNENNTDCLIYNINNNTFSKNNTYLKGCLRKYSSLNIEYLNNSYFIYCYQSPTKYNLI